VQPEPPGESLRVLLVEDDEDDYVLARELFADFRGNAFRSSG
jgi:hypothetical protein